MSVLCKKCHALVVQKHFDEDLEKAKCPRCKAAFSFSRLDTYEDLRVKHCSRILALSDLKDNTYDVSIFESTHSLSLHFSPLGWSTLKRAALSLVFIIGGGLLFRNGYSSMMTKNLVLGSFCLILGALFAYYSALQVLNKYSIQVSHGILRLQYGPWPAFFKLPRFYLNDIKQIDPVKWQVHPTKGPCHYGIMVTLTDGRKEILIMKLNSAALALFLTARISFFLDSEHLASDQKWAA